MSVLPMQWAYASVIELTTRPSNSDVVDWRQLGTPTLTITTPQNFTSAGGITGNVNLNGVGLLVQQCCIGLAGTFDGDFAPGDKVLETSLSPLTINFNSPVRSVGAQIQDGGIGDHFTAEILAFSGSTLIGTFTENGFSGDVGDNSNIFLGVQDSTADITSVTYLTFTSDPSFKLQDVAINQLSVAAPVPEPNSLTLLATGFAAIGLFGWYRSRRTRAEHTRGLAAFPNSPLYN
jgi:hypothetical protein